MRSKIQIAALDRRTAALHEAGHFVLAQWAGVREIGAWIAPINVADPMKRKTWIGQCVYTPRQFDAISVRRQMMVAVAGAFAEQVWGERFTGDYIEVGDSLWDANFMSDSDWDMTGGCGPDYLPNKLVQAAESVVESLRGPLWQPLLVASRTLIRDGTLLPDGLSVPRRDSLQRSIGSARENIWARIPISRAPPASMG
jgi:hypothetical protein